MQKNLPTIFFVLSCVILASCAKDHVSNIRYKLTIDEGGKEKRLELMNAVQRNVTREITQQNIQAVATAIPSSATEGSLTIQLTNAKESKKVRDIIEQPFSFSIRTQNKLETSTGAVAKAEWSTSDIDARDIQWIQVIGDKASGQIGVEIQFTPDGRKKMEKLFADLVQKNAETNTSTKSAIGIFVRDKLISQLDAQGKVLQSRIVIMGIPSPAIAQGFADDVNTGVHVHFAPQS